MKQRDANLNTLEQLDKEIRELWARKNEVFFHAKGQIVASPEVEQIDDRIAELLIERDKVSKDLPGEDPEGLVTPSPS